MRLELLVALGTSPLELLVDALVVPAAVTLIIDQRGS